MAQSWLKFLLNGRVDSQNNEKESTNVQQEKPIEDVPVGGSKNKVNEKDILNNNGNVPMVQVQQSENDEMMGWVLQRTTPAVAPLPMMMASTENPPASNTPADEQEVVVADKPVGDEQVVTPEVVSPEVVVPTETPAVNNTDEQAIVSETVGEGPDHVRGHRHEHGDWAKNIAKVEYTDGKATVTMKDGKTFTRPAFKGEPGYVNDGESVDERIARVYPTLYKKATTPEAKAELVRRYFQKFYDEKNLSDATQRSDYMKLLKNSDQTSEYTQILGQTVHFLRVQNRGKVVDSAMNSMVYQEQKEAYLEGVTFTIDLSNDDPEVQKQLIAKLEDNAKTLGNGYKISEIMGDKAVYCNGNQCMMIDVATALGGEHATIRLLNSTANEDGASFTPEAERHLADVTSKTITTEEAGAAYTMASTRISKENQVYFVQTGYDNVQMEEARDAMLDTQGKNVGNYHKDVQLEVDEIARKYDDPEKQIYNISAANHLHEADVDNQQELVDRTTESGNEEALNNVANHLYEFDINNRDSILQALQNCGYDSVMESIEKAKAEYEAQQKNNERLLEGERRKQEMMENESKEPVVPAQTKTNSSNPKQRISQRDDKAFKKAKEVKSLKGTDYQNAIEDLAKNAPLSQLQALADSGLRDDLIKYLLAHPSLENKAKIEKLVSNAPVAEQQKLNEIIEKSNSVMADNFFVTKK